MLVCTIYQVPDVSAGCKQAMQYAIRFSDTLEEELNSYFIQFKIARKYGTKSFKGKKKMNLKYQFVSI